MSAERRRWAIFARSVISPVDNPDAHVLRAIGRELVRQGQEVVFYEERANPAVQALLRREGARALDQFRQAFPEITYRTMDPRSGPLLEDWLNRVLATTDVALVQFGSPAVLAEAIGRLTRSHLRTFLIDTGMDPVAEQTPIERVGPGSFSAVLAGSEAAAARHRTAAGPVQVELIGPIREAVWLTPNPEQPTAARRLVDQLLALSTRPPDSSGSTIGPNGHGPG